jgi:putative ATPase
VFTFKPLNDDDISLVIEKALEEDAYLKKLSISINDKAKDALVKYSGGDARTALNALEVAVELGASDQDDFNGIIEVSLVERALMVRQGRYDKKGDYHFDVISAFIKSLRGSDPDGAIYWLARMIDAGEDPLFIARRMVILASEDIGNCNPTALILAQSCAEAVKFVGMPEAQLILAQTAIYLASSPKSNSTLTALLAAMDDVKKDPDRPVPLHLRNAVTGLMKAQNYGRDYKYAHDHDGSFTEQQYLPDELKDRIYYYPSDQGVEKTIAERLQVWWHKRKPNKAD